jgi:hypothetical protein
MRRAPSFGQILVSDGNDWLHAEQYASAALTSVFAGPAPEGLVGSLGPVLMIR